MVPVAGAADFDDEDPKFTVPVRHFRDFGRVLNAPGEGSKFASEDVMQFDETWIAAQRARTIDLGAVELGGSAQVRVGVSQIVGVVELVHSDRAAPASDTGDRRPGLHLVIDDRSRTGRVVAWLGCHGISVSGVTRCCPPRQRGASGAGGRCQPGKPESGNDDAANLRPIDCYDIYRSDTSGRLLAGFR